MSRPLNNLALTHSEVPLKIFVKENEECTSKQTKSKKFDLKFTGVEARVAYEEVISQINQSKSLPKKHNVHSKNSNNELKTPAKAVETNVKNINVNSLFKAIELGDKHFVTQYFHKENVNICDQFGWTPLMSAAYCGHIEIVNFLLKLGASTRAKDKSGLTAIDLALKKNHLDVINLIKQVIHKSNKKVSKSSNEPNSSKSTEEAVNKDGFYCDICKITFIESSRKKHETSTLHIFNTKPKIKNTYYGIPKQNKGYQIMLNTGWDEEGGLGPSGEGQKYPVKTVLKRDREGLGRTDKKVVARVTHFNPRDTNAIKHVNRHKRKAFKKKDLLKQINRDAAKTRALRQSLA